VSVYVAVTGERCRAFKFKTRGQGELKKRCRVLRLLRVNKHQGRVVRKPFNANPGLKVNGGINFSSAKISLTARVLCSLSLVKLKTERQALLAENLTEKLQN